MTHWSLEGYYPNFVKQKRKEKGLLQKQLAILAEVNPIALSQLESGRRRMYPKLRKAVAAALQSTEEELFPWLKENK